MVEAQNVAGVSVQDAAPVTHADETPADLVGQLVRIRPHYHVPSGRSSLTPARSPYTYEARVVGVLADMVVVQHEWTPDSAPWRRLQAYKPSELHYAYGQCPCAACVGDGIHALHGA